MPRDERYPPDDPREWLRIARQDLTLADVQIEGVGFGLLAYHAQQAAEKAIKAILVSHRKPIPPTHDLGRLLDHVRATGPTT